jgi:hypothetical protein
VAGVSTTVIACIQQVPRGDAENPSGDDTSTGYLPMQELSATGDDYLAAVDAVESQVPDGWRVLYVRAEDAPLPTAPPTGPSEGTGEGAGEGAGEAPPVVESTVDDSATEDDSATSQ